LGGYYLGLGDWEKEIGGVPNEDLISTLTGGYDPYIVKEVNEHG